MDSNLHHHYQNPQQIMNSGLTRYRSAPSSYFSNLINSGVYGDEDSDSFFCPRVLSPETERILSGFDNSSFHQPLAHNSKSIVSSCSSAMTESLMAMDPPTNLLRQSSSPADFFSIDNGYSLMRSMDNFEAGSSKIVPNSSFSPAKRLKSQMGFSSSSSLLPHIPENEGKTMAIPAHNHGGFGSGSWNESAILTDSFMKELAESDQKLLQFQDFVPLRSRAKRGCATHPRSIAERVRNTNK